MKAIITHHPDIGYSNNVDIIERTLRQQFGIDDQSHIIRSVAAHIWSELVSFRSQHIAPEPNSYQWSINDISNALRQCELRLELIGRHLIKLQAAGT